MPTPNSFSTLQRAWRQALLACLLVAALVFFPAVTSAAPAASHNDIDGGGFWYTIQRGDTLYSIALRYGATVEDLMAANGISNPRKLKTGRRLWIPDNSLTPPPSGQGFWYTVQPSDTLYSLARDNGTTVHAIAVANHLREPWLIKPGQQLWIPTPNQHAPYPGPWTGLFYANKALNGPPVLVRNTPKLDFDWGPASPDALIPPDNFSALWTGTFKFAAGKYRFFVRTDDGARLKIDGVTWIDGWREQAPTGYFAEVNLSADNHIIVVEYFEAVGGASIRVTWQKIQ